MENKESKIIESGFYCNGEWIESSPEKIFENYNPATGKILSKIGDFGRDSAKEAIRSAIAAFPKWASKSPKERAKLLLEIAENMNANSEKLARIITLENGKPLRESMAEIAYAADFFVWYAEECKRANGEIVTSNDKNKWRLVVRQPIGVVGIISPWNFPMAMLTRKLAPALAAGCTAVVKPAEQTPCSAIEIFRIMDSVGIPPGVVNLICTSSPGPIGMELCENPNVRLVTFTGSAEIGKHLIRQSAKNVTNLCLEHGGNAAFVVFDDAVIPEAVKGLIACKFRNAGQTCICANRVFVQSSIADKFIPELKSAIRNLKIGNGLDSKVDIGPLIDQSSFIKVNEHVIDAMNNGAKCLCGGQRFNVNQSSQAFFYQPTLLTNVQPSMRIFKEETFGPVVPVMLFDDKSQIFELVNNTRYGLAAYAYTTSISTALEFAERVEAGVIGINDPIPSLPECPFGGFKQSGIGREGGWQGLDEYLETKYISIHSRLE